MDASLEFLREIAALPGPSGMEQPVAQRVAQGFGEFSDDVWIDSHASVYARIGSGKPRVVICAHLDEIALMVSAIDKRGFLRLQNIGGVDPRILPGMEVMVHGKTAMPGVIGATPPHLQTAGEQNKAIKREDLCVDIGYPAAKVNELVSVGDIVTFRAPLLELDGGRIAGKTMDDRACVAIEHAAMKLLSRMKLDCEVIFVATCQEEIGSKGALMVGQSLGADIAIALDVCHAPQPGADDLDVSPFEKPALLRAPVVHAKLFERAKKVADANGIPYSVEISAGTSSTDADELQFARGGMPAMLISLPLRYMHTSVETFDQACFFHCARWLAHLIADFDAGWEAWLCY